MKIKIASTLALVALCATSPAFAGIYSDDATRCVVKSSSDGDKITLVQWIFAGVAVHPALKTFSNVTDEQRDTLNKQMNTIVMRLLTKDCRKEVVEALKYEGSGFLEGSFQALGQIAMGSMTTNPAVSESLTAWVKYMDKDALVKMGEEAGRPVPTK